MNIVPGDLSMEPGLGPGVPLVPYKSIKWMDNDWIAALNRVESF